MRIYLPATPNDLRELSIQGAFRADVGFIVDEALRVAYELTAEDDEVAEFLAMGLAADFAHRRGDPITIVVAADMEPSAVIAGSQATPASVELGRVNITAQVDVSEIASFHVGDWRAQSVAPGESPALDAGDLAWWAVQELAQLLTSLE